jgi:mRNA interferase MazF
LIIKRGEVWLVDFNPTKGTEIQKIRPAAVVSSDVIGRLPLKIVAPITEWDKRYQGNIWHIKIINDKTNGLVKPSAIDTLQIRSVDESRFNKKLGMVSSTTMEEIVAAIAAIIEYE